MSPDAATGPEPSIIQRAVLGRVARLSLPHAARVLDAPCGAGALSLALARKGFDVAAADLDAGARATLGERFRIADLNGSLPWPDATFDTVCSVEGIEHLENGFAFLREVRRVLRPGGVLLLTTPNTVSLRSRVRFLGSGFYHQDPRPLNESARHPLHHIGLRTFAELRYALETSGLRLIDADRTHVKPVSFLYAGYVPWIWLYTRIAFRKEKDAVQRARNREIRRALLSPAVLFGENLMLVAAKPRAEGQEPATDRSAGHPL
jgi:2-polyprenyl-3-methyl-5-hydroxy-6-metoxy-1,4-benzoquinol methylase